MRGQRGKEKGESGPRGSGRRRVGGERARGKEKREKGEQPPEGGGGAGEIDN